MAVSVSVRSYTHAVTYVTDNLLRSLKDVIRLSGLDPSKFASDWNTLHNGIKTWIESGHLNTIVLEVYNPSDNSLVGRWDIAISYGYTSGDGSFWTDTDDIRYAIMKAGRLRQLVPVRRDCGQQTVRTERRRLGGQLLPLDQRDGEAEHRDDRRGQRAERGF